MPVGQAGFAEKCAAGSALLAAAFPNMLNAPTMAMSALRDGVPKTTIMPLIGLTIRDTTMRLLRHITALFAGLLLAGSVMATEANYGYQENIDNPGIFAMVGDLIIARPIGAAVTAVGAAACVVSLPFTALAGNTAEAGQELVVRPGRETFMRCLGCTKSGYGRKQREESL